MACIASMENQRVLGKVVPFLSGPSSYIMIGMQDCKNVKFDFWLSE